jgi:hypothetical protein
MDRINSIVVRNPSGNFSKDDQLLLTEIFTEMQKAGGSIKKTADEMKKKYPGVPSGPPSVVGGQPVGTSSEVAIAKALADQVNGKNGVFALAVDKFILAVDKFSGITGKPYEKPGDSVSPVKFGPLPTGIKSTFMQFSSSDGKKKIQVGVTSESTEAAYKAYSENGWKFTGYSTKKSSGTKEYAYTKMSPINNVPKAAMGGKIVGPGTSISDSIPAFLSNGEYVVRASSVNKYGTKMFDDINMQRFAMGGLSSPRYNVPKEAASIGNNQITGYNRGGSIHHYNAGGIVVNAAQGQDVKELAGHIVNIMDARGARRQSMNGGGITV